MNEEKRKKVVEEIHEKVKRIMDKIANEPNLKRGTYNGMSYLIKRNMTIGTLNGYVAIPQFSKFYGKNDKYDYINELEVHGGITFTDFWEDNVFYLGFDTAHAWDFVPYMNIGKVGYELRGIEGHDLLVANTEYRDIEYVEKECKSLIDQLLKIEPHLAVDKESKVEFYIDDTIPDNSVAVYDRNGINKNGTKKMS